MLVCVCSRWTQFDGTIVLVSLLVLFLLLGVMLMWWLWPLCCTLVSGPLSPRQHLVSPRL